MAGREQLAAEAVHVERELIKERVGLQDQYACACGGFSKLEFRDENAVTITPVPISNERRKALAERLVLFYTGQQRTAHEVLETQIARTNSGALKTNLRELHGLVDRGMHALASDSSLSEFGQLLHMGWMLKKQFSDAVSNPLVDDAYNRARDAGAEGGKLLGAGGGGFLLICADPAKLPAVRKALAPMREVNFDFDNQGSRLIFYKP